MSLMVKWSAAACAVLVALGAGYWMLRPEPMAMDPHAGMAGQGGLPRAMTSTFISGIAEGAPIVAPVLPASLSPEAEMGKRAFEAKCAECHGENAAGKKGAAPPLIHKIYEPGHHSDYAFTMAVQSGVRAHHWPFGDMPPVPGLTQADVKAIAAYVREIQRANGIN